MDLDVEIAKCDKKLGLAQLNLDKVKKVEAQPNYEETIPVDVRIANEEKVCDNMSTCTETRKMTYLLNREKNARRRWLLSPHQKRCSRS